MEVDDLDFMELLPVLGDELGDEDKNFTLSQIADRIEVDYIKSECMISNFADMTFDLGYQSESGETGPSHSNMEVTTIQDTCTLSENSGNPVKDESPGQLRPTLRKVQHGQFVCLMIGAFHEILHLKIFQIWTIFPWMT